MKAIVVMFDSLNRNYLPNYGNEYIKAPNFEKLGKKTVTFDNSYVGSMPCMPARRDLHTGRLNFLHRSWGPLEPYDISVFELLREKKGVYSHLVTDHQHYFEDGGCNYHTRYNSWEFFRGQEGDMWKSAIVDEYPSVYFKRMKVHDKVNRTFMDDEKDMSSVKTFNAGLEFIETNHSKDNWILQLETFDPHEPFFSSKRFRDMYKDNYEGEEFDWPPYGPLLESDTDEKVKRAINRYCGLVSMCDYYLGKVLDMMDENNMWEDTMLIVNTDHGYLLGEKQWWSKSVMPTYNEVAHTPMFIWDPSENVKNERRKSLVQNIDIAPTLLDFFGVDIPEVMHGQSLKATIRNDKPVRQHAFYGYHGAHINVTDGRYTYMRSTVTADNAPLYEYTLMPTHMRNMFTAKELQTLEISNPFDFTNNIPLMKIDANKSLKMSSPTQYGTKLFDLNTDPNQENSIKDASIEKNLIKVISDFMKKEDAPIEQYERLGIPFDGIITEDEIKAQYDKLAKALEIPELEGYRLEPGVQNMIQSTINMLPDKFTDIFLNKVKDNSINKEITQKNIKEVVSELTIPDNLRVMLGYLVLSAGRTY